MNSVRFLPNHPERVVVSSGVIDHGRYARVVYRNARRCLSLDRSTARAVVIGRLVQCGAIATERAS